MKKFLNALLGAILWLLDFDNILVFILIPAGLIAIGVMVEAGWLYYPVILGIYAAIVWTVNQNLNKLTDAGAKAFVEWLERRKK